ncbi:MAG: glycosyltransferase [Myxococcota bacterium]
MSPLFTVVIPLYNHERYIREAVESVLAQNEADLELVIVDDDSTDGSRERVEALDDPRIRYFSQENSGAHAAINRGIELAGGEWVAVLNSDDIFHPDRLKVAREHFETDSSLSALFTGYEFIGEDSEVIRDAHEIGERWAEPEKWMGKEVFGLLEEKEQLVLRLLGGNFFHSTSNLIARREALHSVGAFAAYRYVHDYDFFLRLASRERVVFDSRSLLRYRLHEDNTLGENAAHSVYETGLVLVDFLSRQPLSFFGREDELFFGAYRYLYEALRGYGAERMVLSALVAGAGADAPSELAARLDGDEETRAFLLERLGEAAAADTEKDRLKWQKEQTDIWWQRADELEEQLTERDQTLAEREGALEESQRSVEWQKEQTDIWWQRADRLEGRLTERDQTLAEREGALEESQRSLEWQKEQTDNWWIEAEQRGARMAADRRWLGLVGVARVLRDKVAGFFR